MKLHSKVVILSFMMIITIYGCRNDKAPRAEVKDDFTWFVEQFEDIRILKYTLPAFEELTAAQKEYIYYLSQAALAGRDILWDQNFRYNLIIRKTIEAIIDSYSGDRNTIDYKSFMVYAKRVFFSNGIHHHYSSDKFRPGFDQSYFASLVRDPIRENFLLKRVGPLIN